MSEKQESCAICKFWVKGGLCRRHPPKMLMSKNAQYPEPYLPEVTADEWCGEFVEKEVQSDEP